MSATAANPPHTLSRRIVRKLYDLDHRAGKYDRTLRLRDLIHDHGRNDWGHRLMTLVGRKDTGSWGSPRVRDIYYREVWDYAPGTDRRSSKPVGKHMEVTRHGMTAWDGVMKRGEAWKTLDSQDDGFTIRIGRLGDDGRLHDGPIEGREEIALLRRWLLWDGWIKAEWFGLRPWLYYKGLRAAVDRRIPFTCQRVPDPDAGGYSHWHCDVPMGMTGALRRWTGRPVHHDGAHLFGNYRWVEGQPVEYAPAEATS